MPKITELPAFLVTEDAIVPLDECTRADIEYALKATDSREHAADLRRVLRHFGNGLQGNTTVGDLRAKPREA